MGRSQRSKVEIHGTLYLSPEGSDWPQLPGGPVGGGEPGPAPTLTSLDPNTAELNAPDITMHCHGSGFTAESVIVFAGQDEPIVFISENEITTGITLSLPWGAVTVPVSVRNADGQQTADLDFTFTEAVAEVETPMLLGVTPNSAYIGHPGITVQALGSNFVAGSSVVSADGSPKNTVFYSDTNLRFDLPAADLAAGKTISVTVSNDGGVTNTGSRPFYVTGAAPASPVVTSISPASLPAGSPDTQISVLGTGFDAGSVATLNGTLTESFVTSETYLQTTVPAALMASAGTIAVGVNKQGVGPSNTVDLTITAAADDEATTTKTARKKR